MRQSPWAFPLRRRLRAAALALSVALPIVLSHAAHAAGTLTYCSPGAPEGFDIAQFENGNTFDAAGLALYDQLVAFKPGTADVVPGLAESWQEGEGGRTYTFKLRAGVHFHETPWFKPTRTMNADDVTFTFQRMLDKQHPAHAAARNGFVYWAGMDMPGLVKSVDKLDAMTVRFTLTRPESPFLANMAIATIGSVFSAEYAAQLQAAGKLEQLNTQPVGTGPFVFRSYQKDAVIRYAAHPKYWAGVPKFDQMVFAISTDPDVRLQRMKAGECLVTIVNPDMLPRVADDPQLLTVPNKPLMTLYVAPNHQRAPTSNKALREALWLAIDRSAIIKGAYGGRATPAVSFLPAAMWGRDTTMAERRDVERARELVKASGYDGRELQFFVSQAPAARRAGESLQSDWAAIGVKVKLQVLELGELTKRAGRGEHDLVLRGWYSDNGDPDNFFTPNLACAAVAGGGNKSRWCHAPFDALLDEARRITDRPRRVELYRQAQRMVVDEVALMPLLYIDTTIVVNRRVEGFVPSPFDNVDFRAVSLK